MLRGPPLPASTLSYFRAVQARVEELEAEGQRQRRGAEERAGTALDAEMALSVSAALRELRGVEYRVLVNRHGSRCVERLVAHCSRAELAELLTQVAPTAPLLFTDRNASHPLQRALRRLPQELRAEEAEQEAADGALLRSALLSLCAALSASPAGAELASSPFSVAPSSYWPLLLCSEQASHLARTLFAVLADDEDVERSAPRAPAQRQQPSASSRPTSRDDSGVFLAVVESLQVLSRADHVELSFHASASPALQTLLQALSTQSERWRPLLRGVLAFVLLSAPTAPFKLSAAAVSHVRLLARHRVGSHLLECALTVSSAAAPDVFHALCEDALMLPEDAHELAMHPLANHVLQRALTCCAAPQRRMLRRVTKALRPHLREYLSQSRRTPDRSDAAHRPSSAVASADLSFPLLLVGARSSLRLLSRGCGVAAAAGVRLGVLA